MNKNVDPDQLAHSFQKSIYCVSLIYTRGDQKVRGKVLLHRIAFIDCNENSYI